VAHVAQDRRRLVPRLCGAIPDQGHVGGLRQKPLQIGKDSAGFIATLDTPVAIDGIQCVPELMTEIKLCVDRDKAPAQFAITGSANLLEGDDLRSLRWARSERVVPTAIEWQ
jgi:hypothetical protein